jgi:hypothetical protein
MQREVDRACAREVAAQRFSTITRAPAADPERPSFSATAENRLGGIAR